MTSTQPLEHTSFEKPDEVREGTNCDAWVVGDEQVVAIDWQGASVWAAHQA